MNKNIKYIFEIKIRIGYTAQEYIDAWKKGSAIIQKTKGAKGTILFRKLGDQRTLLAIATWESKEARDAAMKQLKSEKLEIREIIDKHKKYATFNQLGYFEEMAQVSPE